jgi:hypothetical protein
VTPGGAAVPHRFGAMHGGPGSSADSYIATYLAHDDCADHLLHL